MARLLIIVRKVDSEDLLLGFFIEWIRAFARHFNQVTVLGLGVGAYHLPENVRILSLGEEKGRSRFKYLFNFFHYLYRERKNYDAVFVHASPQYVVLGAAIWRLLKKKITLWYAHGSVNFMLWIAEKWADIIFTSTSEGFRLSSRKLRIVGQGIDTEVFKSGGQKVAGKFKIITVGRITPAKDYETLIGAVELIRHWPEQLDVEIFGGPVVRKDQAYLEKLKKVVDEKGLSGTIKFMGPIANYKLPPVLQSANLFVNMGQTGSLDKAMVEAMACETIVLSCNEAFAAIMGVEYVDRLVYPKKDPVALAKKIEDILALALGERKALGLALRAIVVAKHDLNDLVSKISAEIKYGSQ